MGKSSAQTIGYHYRVAYHHGLSATPIDALLEIRCADKTAWSGSLAASGTININQPNLFGGEKDQGGIVGDVDVMFGEPTQTPNAYLGQAFGPQQPAWRGVTTLVFKGGRFGANNPYPQKPAYRVKVTTKGWDGDTCWYPEKCEVALTASDSLPANAPGWQYQIVPMHANPGRSNLVVPTAGWLSGATGPFISYAESGDAQFWPYRKILWLKRTVTIQGVNQMLRAAADNGCALFINGALVVASNPDNLPINDNTQYPVSFPVSAGNTYEIAVKAYPEDSPSDDSGNGCTVTITSAGLTAINPAHLFYDALTSQDRGGEPTASLNDANWRTGADWFFAQGIGLCTEFDPDSETVEQLIQRIEKVAACSVSRSPVDGEWYLDIANGVYTLASLPILTDDEILDFEETSTNLDDAINSISVEYFDPQQKITATTPPVQSLALINANGLHHDVRSYHELPTSDLANRTAQRDLQMAITPPRTFTLTTTRKPYAWRVNTYFRLQSPKRGIADMVCLLAEKSTGTLKSGAIKITASQDIYSMPTASFVTSEPGVDTRPPQVPAVITQQAAFEAPYTSVCASLNRADLAALPSDVGYLMTVAQDPGQMRDYAITVSVDGGTTYTDTGADGPWRPTALIIEGDVLQDAAPATSFTLASGAFLTSIVVGQAALWQNVDGTFEIVRVDAINPAATPPTLTLGRGCADTVPAPHAASSRIWFFDGFAGADTTEYTDGEALTVKLLTNSGAQQLASVQALPLALVFDQRQFRPYPPAGLKINTKWYPQAITGDLALSWVQRNRLQQADQLIDTTQTGVAGEADSSVRVDIYDAANALLKSVAGITADSLVYTAGEESNAATGDPAWNDVRALLHFDGTNGSTTFTDATGRAWSQYGAATISTAQSKFGGSSLYVPSSCITTPHNANLVIGATPFTIDMWVMLTSYPGSGNYPGICGKRLSGSSGGWAIVTNGTAATNYIFFQLTDSIKGANVNTNASGLSLNQWYFLRACGKDGLLELSIDGVVTGTVAYTSITDSGTYMMIGKASSNNDNATNTCFGGYIDDFRFTLGTCRSRGNFTPPDAPFSSVLPVSILSSRYRIDVTGVRDGLDSYQHHSVLVDRAGYGYNYGKYYGGPKT